MEILTANDVKRPDGNTPVAIYDITVKMSILSATVLESRDGELSVEIPDHNAGLHRLKAEILKAYRQQSDKVAMQ